MMNRYVYLLFKDDELKLPMCVADTIQELSELSGINIAIMRYAFLNNTTFYDNLKIEKVDIKEPLDDCCEDYEDICDFDDLSFGSFSLRKKLVKV